MSALLAKTRAAFGPSPRTIKTWDNVEPPRWMKADDPLRKTFAQARDLLLKGDIVWGHIVQANTLLFSPGNDDCPAAVLFESTPGPAGAGDDFTPERLRVAAHAAAALKGKPMVDPSLDRVGRALADEMGRHPVLDLPAAITRGTPMRMAEIMVPRVYLPSRYLVSNLLPLLANAARDTVMILPVRYWDAELARTWLDLGATSQ